MKNNRSALFLMIIFIWQNHSCTTSGAASSGSTTPNNRPDNGVYYGDTLENLANSEKSGMPARGFVLPGVSPSDGFGAYGYILFTTMPGSLNAVRYDKFCQRYLEGFSYIYNEAIKDKSKEELLPLFWLLANRLPNESLSDCKQLVSNYNYDRSNTMLANLKLNSVDGPILVAWSAPYSDTSSKRDALVMDLSYVPDDLNEIDRAMRLWKKYIAKDPEAWSKIEVIILKEEFRSFLQEYGDDVVDIIKGIADIF